jgi:hypothetical protein
LVAPSQHVGVGQREWKRCKKKMSYLYVTEEGAGEIAMYKERVYENEKVSAMDHAAIFLTKCV